MITTQLATRPDTSAADIESIAGHLVKSGFFKDASDLSKAVVKVLYGAEIGIGPVQAMAGIHIVEGRPSMSAGLIAGLCKRAGYDYSALQSDAAGCVLEWRNARGAVLGQSSFTMDDAKRAGLAGKQNWVKYPADMCFARAVSQGARRYCPDATLGAVYVPEELGANVTPEGDVIDAEPQQSGGSYYTPASVLDYAHTEIPAPVAPPAASEWPAPPEHWKDEIAAASNKAAVGQIMRWIKGTEPNDFRRRAGIALAFDRLIELAENEADLAAIGKSVGKSDLAVHQKAAIRDAAVVRAAQLSGASVAAAEPDAGEPVTIDALLAAETAQEVAL